MRVDPMETGCSFPAELRLVQSGCQVRRVGWDPSLLCIKRNAELDRVELFHEARDSEGTYRFEEGWLPAGIRTSCIAWPTR